MKPVALKPVLVGALLAGVGTGMRVAARPIVRVGLPDRVEPHERDAAPAPNFAKDSLPGGTIAHDPFRIARRPAAVPYDPLRVGQPPAPVLPKPTLGLVGIVWDGGADPTALLEGLPGVDGPRVVRAGEAIGALCVKGITPDRVVIVGLDTTWVLTVREPWK